MAGVCFLYPWIANIILPGWAAGSKLDPKPFWLTFWRIFINIFLNYYSVQLSAIIIFTIVQFIEMQKVNFKALKIIFKCSLEWKSLTIYPAGQSFWNQMIMYQFQSPETSFNTSVSPSNLNSTNFGSTLYKENFQPSISPWNYSCAMQRISS